VLVTPVFHQKSTPGYSNFWREYIKRCLKSSSLKLLPHYYKVDETIVKASIVQLYSEAFEDLQGMMASPCSQAHTKMSDSILKAYEREFRFCNDMEILKKT